MEREYWEQKEVSVYWWNGGTRTLDYKGDYKGFLEKKNITVQEVESHKWHFVIPLAFTRATLDTHGEYHRCADEAIQIFLTLLGDKAVFNGCDRTYHIHWS